MGQKCLQNLPVPKWRIALKIPFRDVHNRAPFFDLFLNRRRILLEGIPGFVRFYLSPDDEMTMNFHRRQLNCSVKSWPITDGTVLIGSHVPYPGSCTRPIAPGIYLEIPEDIQRLLENHSAPVFWVGGHFHWNNDPPLVRGSLTALMGARFAFEGDHERTTYVRELRLEDSSIRTITDLTEK